MNYATPHRARLALAALAVCAALQPVYAAEEAQAEEDIERIVTIGTRVNGRTATETAAPVDIITGDTIKSAGFTETGKILQMIAPSANFSTTTTSDGTDLIRPATLRGLGPDQVLVLVNGKRRHQQALVNVQNTIGRGSAGTDLNAIPVTAISRIEVLRDGAAAQYGSDAISGVINIVLKDQIGTQMSANWGQTYEGDGENTLIGLNHGMQLGEDGFLNISLEYTDRGEMNRATATDWFGSQPTKEVRLLIGDAATDAAQLWFNGAYKAMGGEFYSFGGFSRRDGHSLGFFRAPGSDRSWDAIFPRGFTPGLDTESDDDAIAFGYRREFGDDWQWDLSVNKGNNEFRLYNKYSLNVSYGPSSPTEAYDGALIFDQTTVNFDMNGSVDWGIGYEPLQLAFGAEWRRDGYEIRPGDAWSFNCGATTVGQNGNRAACGMQGFAGYSVPVDQDRHNVALYVDAESYLTEKFLLGAALRWEDYSDAGTNTTGKLSARFQAADSFSLRGSVSTGFRAPGVQQSFFTQRSITLSGGNLVDSLTVTPDSSLAHALGFQPLSNEESKSASIGFVATPVDGWTSTLDMYRIAIDDRIVFSSSIPSDLNSQVQTILAPLNVGQVDTFTNAVDTVTKGVDWVNQYEIGMGGGDTLTLEGTISYNKTEVEAIHSSSSLIPTSRVFGPGQVTLTEEAQPQKRAIVGATWKSGAWTANLRNNYFGEVSAGPDSGITALKTTWGAKWLTDVQVGYEVTDDLRLTVGGNNIFDVYPDEWSDAESGGLNSAGFKYGWETLPFGIAGGMYYARAEYHF
ncbi:MAG: TonB-dependent receptor [Gammaproteobacteria bacterium]|nr:TonB-dependent receptor [Gammaproteobacteria bacterium]